MSRMAIAIVVSWAVVALVVIGVLNLLGVSAAI